MPSYPLSTLIQHPPRLRSLLARAGIFSPVLLLCQCQGVVGALTARTHCQGSFLIAEVYTAGAECANLPGRCGISLGSRKTTIVQELSSPCPPQLADKSFTGGLPALPGRTVHISTVLRGMELACDATYAGFSFGLSSRSVSDLPPDLSTAFLLRIDPDRPSATSVTGLPLSTSPTLPSS